MMNTYKNLMVISLDQKAHESTCGYWYIIQTLSGMSHAGFSTLKGLENYLEERGLELEVELPEHGNHGVSFIKGEYNEHTHTDTNEFYSLNGMTTRTLSNGDYTLAIITVDDDGVTHTVHTLNPNVTERVVFDYFESRREMS